MDDYRVNRPCAMTVPYGAAELTRRLTSCTGFAMFRLACALRRHAGQWHLGKNLRPSHGARLHGEPSADEPKSFSHSHQTDPCAWVTPVRVKTSARVGYAKTDAIRVRAQFNVRTRGVTRFDDVAE